MLRPTSGKGVLAVAVALAALIAPAHAQIIINGGTFTGAMGGNGVGSNDGFTGNMGGEGGVAYAFSSGTLTINDGTFTGGTGGTGAAAPPSNPPFPSFAGMGGNGGAALSLNGGTTTINGGSFRGGDGGANGPGPSFVPSGIPNIALGANGAGTVVNIYGGSYSIGNGFAAPPVFSVTDNAVVNFFTQPGTFLFDGSTVSGTFLSGEGFSYSASSSSGGIFQEGVAAVVPEAGTFALALPALGMIGAVVIAKRRKK